MRLSHVSACAALVLASAAQANAGSLDFGCNQVGVEVVAPGWTISSIDCSVGHGKVEFQRTTFAILSNRDSGSFGPDCNMSFSNGTLSSVVNVQQNYCFFSAGDITVKRVSGETTPNVEVAIGAFAGDVAGSVKFTTFGNNLRGWSTQLVNQSVVPVTIARPTDGGGTGASSTPLGDGAVVIPGKGVVDMRDIGHDGNSCNSPFWGVAIEFNGTDWRFYYDRDGVVTVTVSAKGDVALAGTGTKAQLVQGTGGPTCK